jgi:hypothetical protein
MVFGYFKEVLIVLATAIALSACVSSKFVVSDVTRHHDFGQVPSGATFKVMGSDTTQSQSLAFSAYSVMVEKKLSNLGFVKQTETDQIPDIIVTMEWSVEGPSPDIKSRNNGFSYGIGYGTRYGHLATSGVFPYEGRTSTKQLYNRNVQLVIYAGDTYNTDKRQRLFESSVVSVGNRPTIDMVMTYIMDAIFNGFPGKSGENMVVRIPVEEGSPLDSSKMQNSRMGQ